MRLPQLYFMIDHLGGAEHNKKCVAVCLQLRALVRPMCIFDSKFVKAQLLLNFRQRFRSRLMKSNPYKLIWLLKDITDIFYFNIRHLASFLVCRAVNYRFGAVRLLYHNSYSFGYRSQYPNE